MSNAFDKASLVMLPHAYEDGKLYSLKPTDRSGDFTFSRGSDTATRVGEDGHIKKETSNLLLQSNQFDTTWTTTNSSVTSGQSGYDGSSDAWLFENTLTTFPRVEQSISQGGVVTFSIYAKAGTNNFIRPLKIGGITAQAYFDLSDGTIANETNTIDSSIKSVGNGWYRCSITFDSSTTAVRIYSADAVGSFGLGNIHIQDAQLNQGLVAQDYLETTTAPVYGGLTDNMPRLDYTDATCPSLLLEPSRTNLLPYSEYLGTGISSNGCTQTITNETNPSGNDVSYLVGAIDNVNDQIRYDKSGLSSGSYFISAFVKGDGNANEIRMRGTGNGVTTGNVYWDVAADGTITLDTSASPSGVNAIAESYGNGWYRIGLEETFDGTGTGRMAIYPSRGGINISTYIWGVQWEAGSYPTSYIPTYGSSQTRVADVLFEGATGFSNFFNATEGTLFFQVDEPLFRQLTTDGRSIALRDTTNGEYFQLRGRSNSVYFLLTMCSPNVISVGNFENNTKYAMKWNGSEIKIFTNGAERGSASQVDSFRPYTLGVATGFGMYTPTGEKFNNITFFPTALSDSECISLTTL